MCRAARGGRGVERRRTVVPRAPGSPPPGGAGDVGPPPHRPALRRRRDEQGGRGGTRRARPHRRQVAAAFPEGSCRGTVGRAAFGASAEHGGRAGGRRSSSGRSRRRPPTPRIGRSDRWPGSRGFRGRRWRGGSERRSGCNRTGRRRSRFPAPRGSWTRRGTSRGSLCRRRPARWRSAAMRRAGDKDTTHKTASVKAWPARCSRDYAHFTPTSASWIDQAERRFAEPARKRLQRGARISTKRLEADIRAFNRPARPGPETFGTARNRRRSPRIRRTLLSPRRPHIMRRTLDAGH